MSLKVLIIDDHIYDESEQISALPSTLEAAGYEVVTGENVETAFDLVWETNPDLIVLDIKFDGAEINGIELCQAIREDGGNMPIILITSVFTETEDLLRGFEVGADDYIKRDSKTDIREIIARIRANLPPEVVEIDDHLRIDSNAYQVWINNGDVWEEVHFRPLEFNLLMLLVINAGRVLPVTTIKDRLFDKVVGDGALGVYIHRLRKKIEPKPAEPTFIKRVAGVGYLFTGKVRRSSRPGL